MTALSIDLGVVVGVVVAVSLLAAVGSADGLLTPATCPTPSGGQS